MGMIGKSQSTQSERIKAWIARHYVASIVIASIASLFIGVAVGGLGAAGDATRLRANIAEMRDEAARINQSSEDEIASLDDTVLDLNEEKSELSVANEELSLELVKLNAKRPMPDVVGTAVGSLERLANDFGWSVKTTHRFSTARAGSILSQTPEPGTMMRFEAPILVVVAKSPPRVPDLVGEQRGKALSALGQHDWKVTEIEQTSNRPPGTVLAVSPTRGQRLMPGSAVTLTVAVKAPPPSPPPTTDSGGSCTPGYSPCLPPASDYDCAGGSGDGPKYTGYVTVTGSDPYGLDSDSDGGGCES